MDLQVSPTRQSPLDMCNISWDVLDRIFDEAFAPPIETDEILLEESALFRQDELVLSEEDWSDISRPTSPTPPLLDSILGLRPDHQRKTSIKSTKGGHKSEDEDDDEGFQTAIDTSFVPRPVTPPNPKKFDQVRPSPTPLHTRSASASSKAKEHLTQSKSLLPPLHKRHTSSGIPTREGHVRTMSMSSNFSVASSTATLPSLSASAVLQAVAAAKRSEAVADELVRSRPGSPRPSSPRPASPSPRPTSPRPTSLPMPLRSMSPRPMAQQLQRSDTAQTGKSLKKKKSRTSISQSADGQITIVTVELPSKLLPNSLSVTLHTQELFVSWKTATYIEQSTTDGNEVIRECIEKRYKRVIPVHRAVKLEHVKAQMDGTRLTLKFPSFAKPKPI